MKYGITKLVLGNGQVHEISESRFCALDAAQMSLLELLFIEEKFDVMVENYLELESELLNTTARQLVIGFLDYEWFQNERRRFNRRFINLLTSCRLYVEQCRHHLRRLQGVGPEVIASLEAGFSEHFDSLLEYRVMEALRNYVQHRGFPIHGLSCNSRWVEWKHGQYLRYSVTPIVEMETLRSDKKFNATVLGELEVTGAKADLKPIVRTYIAALGKVQKSVRETLKDFVDLWDQEVTTAVEEYLVAFPAYNSDAGLAAVAFDDRGVVTQSAMLSVNCIEYRKRLADKNSIVHSIANRYVSGEVV